MGTTPELSEHRRRAQRASAKSRTDRVVRRDVDTYIDRLVSAAPELSESQKAKLAALLTPAGEST